MGGMYDEGFLTGDCGEFDDLFCVCWRDCGDCGSTAFSTIYFSTFFLPAINNSTTATRKTTQRASPTAKKQTNEQPTTEKENNEETIEPGTSIPASIGTTNDFRFDSWLFYDVSVPVVRVDEVKLEKSEEEYVIDGYIPVLRFDVNPGWELVEEEMDSSTLRRVWMYTSPVDVGESYTRLFDSWIMTNFRVADGYSGEWGYGELCNLLNQNHINRRALQSKGISGTPEQLWSMISKR